MRRLRRHLARRAGRLLALVAACLLLSTGIALAWSIGTSHPGNSITALSIGAATSASAVPTPTTGTCTSVTVTWDAATDADRYRVEKSTDGTWATMAASHSTTSITDTTTYTNLTIDYRITPLLSATAWEGPPATTSATCGVGDVKDLVATHGCNDVALTWSAVAGASRYEVWRSVNGGPFAALSTNVSTTGYTDTSAYTAGDELAYYVVPRLAGGAGNQSNTATVAAWDRFRVTSVVLNDAGGGDPVSLAPGDQVVVSFSKPVQPGTATQSTIVASNAGGSRGVYLAAGGASAGATDIGSLRTSSGFVNNGGTFSGDVSWNAARTTWTWTANVGSPNVMDAALTGSWSLGTSATRARCAGDGTTPLADTAPVVSGSW